MNDFTQLYLYFPMLVRYFAHLKLWELWFLPLQSISVGFSPICLIFSPVLGRFFIYHSQVQLIFEFLFFLLQILFILLVINIFLRIIIGFYYFILGIWLTWWTLALRLLLDITFEIFVEIIKGLLWMLQARYAWAQYGLWPFRILCINLALVLCGRCLLSFLDIFKRKLFGILPRLKLQIEFD